MQRQGTKQWTDVASAAVLALGMLGVAQAAVPTAPPQTVPRASQASNVSVFAGVMGAYTGIDQSRNLGITAGADYTIGGFWGLRPAVEARGTYPVHDSHMNDQKSILAGVRVERPIRRFRPYGDFLVGYGSIDYIQTLVIRSHEFSRTDSTVYSPGAGFTYDLTPHLAFRADGQDQYWITPANGSRSAWAKQGTVALTCRFGSIHRER